VRVQVINDSGCIYIKNGDIYNVEEDYRPINSFMIIARDGKLHDYPYSRFVILPTLPAGWRYCSCGTMTSNPDKCCGCK
jgi:hypothetical protein